MFIGFHGASSVLVLTRAVYKSSTQKDSERLPRACLIVQYVDTRWYEQVAASWHSWAELQAKQAQFTERPLLLCQASLQHWPPCMPYVGDDPRCCLWMSLVKLWHPTQTSWHTVLLQCGYSWVKFKDTCHCFTTDYPNLATHNLTMTKFHCLNHISW